MSGLYTYMKSLASPGTTNPLIQIKAGATYGYRVHRIKISQSGSTTSATAETKLTRMSAACTVSTGASGDWGKHSTRDAAIALSFGTTATGFTGSSTGTATDILIDEGFNVLNGFEHFPTPEMRLEIAAGEIVALSMPVAPALTYLFLVTIEEIG